MVAPSLMDNWGAVPARPGSCPTLPAAQTAPSSPSRAVGQPNQPTCYSLFRRLACRWLSQVPRKPTKVNISVLYLACVFWERSPNGALDNGPLLEPLTRPVLALFRSLWERGLGFSSCEHVGASLVVPCSQALVEPATLWQQVPLTTVVEE